MRKLYLKSYSTEQQKREAIGGIHRKQNSAAMLIKRGDNTVDFK